MTAYSALRGLALGFAARAGFHVERICPTHTDRVALLEHLQHYDVDLVLDVGANRGQYALELVENGYRGRIVSYEPLSAPYVLLQREASKHPQWEVAPRCAIGDREDEIEIKISANSVASSPLPLTAAMEAYSPDAAYTGSERVRMHTLDNAAAKALKGSASPLLKIDVQGFEEQVIAGAGETLPRLVGMQIELSLVELYAGQMLFSEMLTQLEARGFILHRLFPSFVQGATGRWLQADALLFRG